MLDEETICAAVVTYNRKESLLRCLEALLEQTKSLDAIYLVDNASTDSTPRALLDKGYIGELPPNKLNAPWERKSGVRGPAGGRPVKFHYVKMHENTGGAGGFYEVIKRGHAAGYDWLWLMDDDGLPAGDALERLVSASAEVHNGRIFNSIVIDRDKPDTIAFGYGWRTNAKDKEHGRHYTDLCKLIADSHSNVLDGSPQFFNSALIHREVIGAVGLPLRKMYIRGDETEYLFRIQTRGWRTYTVLSSKYFHPSVNYLKFFGKTIGYGPMTDQKLYYSVRNAIFLVLHYRPCGNVLTGIAKKIVLFTVVVLKIRRTLRGVARSLFILWKAVFAGLIFKIKFKSYK